VPDWRAELMRLTMFVPSDLTRQVPPWWRQIVGEDPASQTVQQGLGAAHAGPIRGGYCRLVLEVKPGRIDWLLAPAGASEHSPFPQFDSLPGAAAVFRELLVPWSAAVTDARRIAVGVILTAQKENKRAAYEALQDLLPSVVIDPQNSSDLIYQINRHTTSRQTADLQLNRLSNWSALRMRLLQVQVSGGVPSAFSTDQPEHHAMRVQLDMNTAANRTEPLPSGTIQGLVEELLELGIGIAERGDRP